MNPGPSPDSPGAVRDGEQLTMSRLGPWLEARIDDLTGDPEVRQFSGGASNWTYLLRYPERDLVLRRGPAGTKAKGAHNMHREFRIQQAIKPSYPLVPEMLAYCDDPEVIGAEFYVMARVPGIILRKELPAGMVLGERDAHALCERFIDGLIELHRLDYRAAGLAGLSKGSGYVRRQVEGWSERYRRARTWNTGSGERVMRWLEANMPGREGLCLVHNDYRFDNLVLDPADPKRIICVLDWELATIGDPLMDLANTLAYWIEPGDDPLARGLRRQPSHLPGMMTRAGLLEYYCEHTGRAVEDSGFYEVYGFFRLAVIIQQIYFRYHHGQTRNPAFRWFWVYVNYLLWRCHRRMRAAA